MNYDRAKKAEQVKLAGCAVELETRDGSVYSVTIDDGKGGHVKCSSDFGLTLLVPAAPKMVKRWALRGETLGLRVDETFESRFAAESRQSAIDGGVRPDNEGKHDLKIDEVEVPE